MEGKSDIYFGNGKHVKRPWEYLPDELRRCAENMREGLTEIRLRPGRPAQFVYAGGDALGEVVSRSVFDSCLAAMLGHSLYARQDELAKGYFTLPDGSRVGVAGSFSAGGPRMISDIGSLCIRIAREIKGCADDVMKHMENANGVLVVSPPGAGKTTLLRDAARQLSDGGRNVCVIDERDELAACVNGMPTMDIGVRTDVISGMEKYKAMIMAVRACAPDVIIADEIGDERDGAAILEAGRCGVCVIASTHGDSLEPDRLRPVVSGLIKNGIFDVGILLGPQAGTIAEIKAFDRGVGIYG